MPGNRTRIVVVNNDVRSQETGPGPNWMHFIYAGLILLACVAFYQAAQTETLLRRIAAQQRENTNLRKNLSRSEQEFQDSFVRFHSELTAVQQQLAQARQQAQSSSERAQAATRYADVLASKLEKKRRDQEKQQEQLSAELSKVEQSADETSQRLDGISSEVGGVKDTLASVAADATKNSADLGHARGALSELQNGIATNTKEIQLLRNRGDRDIYEFSLSRNDGPRRIGEIQVKLDKTDEKHNTFTLEITADDKRVEKRDKTINEPVEFFVSTRPGQPCELVINEVSKHGVKGYLAAPKEPLFRD